MDRAVLDLYKKDPLQVNGQSLPPTSHTMVSSILVSLALVMLARISLQQGVPQADRAPLTNQWTAAQSPGFGSYNQGLLGYQGLGTGQGFRGQGYKGVQGYSGGDGRYGFDIVDTPDRYGYVSNYPGGRTSFFLLGPNRGPGQQNGWRGSAVGVTGSSQPGSYQTGSYRPGSNSLGGWRQSGAW